MAVSLMTYWLLIQDCIMLSCNFVTLFSMGHLFYLLKFRPRRLQISGLSLAMYSYLSLHIVGAIISLPGNLYRIMWLKLPWNNADEGLSADAKVFHAYTLFWLGIFQMAYNSTSPVPVLFLSLDRIGALLPTHTIAHYKKAISIIGIFMICFCFCFNFTLWPVQELPLDVAAVSGCELTPCEMIKYRSLPQIFIKMAFGTTNFVSSIVFLQMLHKISQNTKINAKNRAVRFSIVCELLLDLFPTYGSFLFNLLSGYSVSTYIGDYISLGVNVDAATCGFYYWRAFAKKNNSVKKAIDAKTVVNNNNNAAACGGRVQPFSTSNTNQNQCRRKQRYNTNNDEQPPPPAGRGNKRSVVAVVSYPLSNALSSTLAAAHKDDNYRPSKNASAIARPVSVAKLEPRAACPAAVHARIASSTMRTVQSAATLAERIEKKGKAKGIN